MGEPHLPITVTACAHVTALFPGLASKTNKLEAFLNFRSLQANWYADEAFIPEIAVFITLISKLDEKQDEFESSEINKPSDDVIFLTKGSQTQCVIALTDGECEILAQNAALISKLLEAKLIKVTNLIANSRGLPAI